jgi:hypothetical protein
MIDTLSLVLGGGLLGACGVVYRCLRSTRQLRSTPSTVHLIVQTQGSVVISLRRKRAGQFRTCRPQGPRPLTLSGHTAVYRFADGASPQPRMTRHGEVTVTLIGVTPGHGTFTVEAPSSRAGKWYGPTRVRVSVYASLDTVPRGITLTPVVP